MSELENRAIVRRVFAEWWTKGDVRVMNQIFADDFIDHNNEEIGGKESIKRTVLQFHRAFPDLKETVDDLVVEGDKAVVRYTARGTHMGEFKGIGPTGREVSFSGIDIYRIVDGSVVDKWCAEDLHGLLQQLGP